jgi:hypothetical protein
VQAFKEAVQGKAPALVLDSQILNQTPAQLAAAMGG